MFLVGPYFLALLPFQCIHDETKNNKMEWPSHENFVVNQFGVDDEPVIRISEIILLVLHIKLGFFKIFIKYIDKENDRLKTITLLLPRLSIQKLYTVIFVGSEIDKVCKNRKFIESLDSTKR